jgi:hypothetical protein
MKLRIMPARMGLTWMGNGLRACIRQPLGFVGLWGLVMCAAILTNQILGMLGLALLGPLLMILVMPLIWMGFMLASRRVLADQRVTPGVLIEPLKDKTTDMRWVWAKLGGAYLLAILLVLILVELLGPGADALSAAINGAKDEAELLSNPDFQAAILWLGVLLMPVSLVFWHTPALVYWGKLPVAKAVFFSTVASWRNLGAFMLFGIGWSGVALALAAINGLLLAVVSEPLLVHVLTTMGAMWMTAAFYASLYFTVIDCFEPDADGLTPSNE